MESKSTHNRHSLTLFALTMITVGSVDSIRNLPSTALFGTELVFFFLFGAIFFLIPCALVSAELASAWPKQGGIYVWVKEAFGRKIGFMAIWLQWISNVIWYPTILSFVAGTIGYLIHPPLIENKYFLIGVILACFWGATFINLLGMRSSSAFSTLCTIAGLLIPMSLIIGLGAAWIFSGSPLHINFKPESFVPSLSNAHTWVALIGIMLSYCGIEIATVHAGDVNNPQKTYPKVLLYSVMIIITTLMLGSLAIAIVLPKEQISLVAGIMQAFHTFFASYNMTWMMPLIALMLILGGLGGVSNWIIAPTKGLLVAAKEGHLPLPLQRENRYGAPVAILIYQAVIVTFLSAVFLFIPTVNGSYWFLTALAAQLYMIMYALMLATGIRLRYKAPEVERAFKIPGGKYFGMIVVAGFGFLGIFTTLAVSFVPPDGVKVGSILVYESMLIGGLILMCAPPFITSFLQKKSWKDATVIDAEIA